MTPRSGLMVATLGPLFFLAPFATIIAPRLTVAFLVLLSIFSIALAMAQGARLKELIRPGLVEALFLAFGLYLFINAGWSADPGRALTKASVVVLFTVLTSATLRALLRWPAELALKASYSFLIGLAVGLAYLLVELLTDRALTIAIYNIAPFTQPSSDKSLVREGAEIVRIQPFELNPNVNVLLLTVWPAILLLTHATRFGQSWLIAAGCFALGLLAIMLSRHATSQVAILVGGLVFLAAYIWPRGVWLGILAGWCLAFVAVIPLALFAHSAQFAQSDWLPHSARARVVLWAYTATNVADAPLLGVGGSSTRALAARPEAVAEAKQQVGEGKIYAWWTGPHAHNIYLQTWYELGVVGVILLMVAGSGFIWRLGGLSPIDRPYMIAHFATFAAVGASSWGMWETWFMALPGLAAIYGAIAVTATRKPG